MKFTPLDNQPNVSFTRFDSISPSMRIDTRGFPHLSWLDQKNGHNEVNYTFWDGLQWAYRQNRVVDRSEEEIISSKNGLIIDDNDDPVVVYSKRIATGSILNANFVSSNNWHNNQLTVTYNTKWIGVETTYRGLSFSSSSSSSWGESSSSSSLGHSSSSSLGQTSSSSSLGHSSSSSLGETSSSSSLGHSSSSSLGESSSSSSWGESSSSSVDSSSSSIGESSSSSMGYSSSSSWVVSSSSSLGESSSSSSWGESSSSSLGESSSSSLGESSSSSFGESSSSSSLGESSSSSSLGESSSSSSFGESSSSSWGESSSSSIDSSSSSTLSSESTLSSSSYNDSNIVVCTYDSDNVLRVYAVSRAVWRLIGSGTFVIPNIGNMKLSSCGNKIGLTYYDESEGLKYNFFDVETEQWSFSEFKLLQNSVTVGTLIDFDTDGFNREEDGVLSIAWMEDNISTFHVRHIFADSAGNEGIFGTSNTSVTTRQKSVKASNYISYGFRSIATSLNSSNSPRIFASGVETALYSKNSNKWTETKVDVEGPSGGLVPNALISQIYETGGNEYVRVAFDNEGGDIYYFEQSSDSGFEMSTPYLVLLNSERMTTAQWVCNEMDGTDIYCAFSNRCGDMLRESLDKIVIVVNEDEDPFCQTSSSSSSHDDESSSSSIYGISKMIINQTFYVDAGNSSPYAP